MTDKPETTALEEAFAIIDEEGWQDMSDRLTAYLNKYGFQVHHAFEDAARKYAALKEVAEQMREKLEDIAKLGRNDGCYGNSDGNKMAIEALAAYDKIVGDGRT